MSDLPSLHNWETTRDNLHRAAMVLGKIRSLLVKPMPFDEHRAIKVAPQGLTTGLLLPSGNEFVLNFNTSIIEYFSGGNIEMFSVSLEGQSPASLMTSLISQMRTVRFASALTDLPTDTAPFVLNPAQAVDYGEVLNLVAEAMARFRDSLSGTMSPLLLGSEVFDLSFTWYAGENEHPQIRFGFAPCGHGIDTPHLYVVAQPPLKNLVVEALPAPTRWVETGEFTGAVIDYADLQAANVPHAMIQTVFGGIFQLMQSG